MITVILSSTILSSLTTLTFNYFQRRRENTDTVKRISRLFLHDVKRSQEMARTAKDHKRPFFSEYSIIENWKHDIHSVLPKLNKSETDAILSYYSKLDDIRKRHADLILTNDEVLRNKADSSILGPKSDGVIRHCGLLTEIDVEELLTKLERLA